MYKLFIFESVAKIKHIAKHKWGSAPKKVVVLVAKSFVRLPVHPSVSLSVGLSISPSIRPSVHPV